jgi:PAS domain S-box-containing protein
MGILRKLSRGIIRDWRGYLLAVALVALATWLKYLAQPNIIPSNVPILYFLAIVPTAIFFGFGPAILVCILSLLAFDYFFIPPLYLINLDIFDVPIMAIFLAVGLLFSYLASDLRRKNLIANREVEARKHSEAELIQYKDHLEVLVKQRTSDLEKANLDLKEEVAERQQAEQALGRQKDILQIIMDNAHTHLVFLDKDFNFVAVNSAYANTCQKTPEELIGKNHFYFYPDEENEAIFKRVRDTGKAESYHDRPFIFPDQPGRGVTYWDWTLTPIKDNSDEVQGLVFSLVETTERKRTEESLERYARDLEAANKELEAFSYSVSHDLRAPLRAIEGFSQALLEDNASQLDADGIDYLRRIRAASQNMSRLIDDILKLSHLSRAEMHVDKVNLSELVASIAAELKNRQPDRQVEITIAPDVVVEGDRSLLQILLTNLLENAWKFTGKCSQSQIEFGVSYQDGKPAYFIRDNGAGFSMAHAGKLFQPFQRLHSNRDYPGNGIGLATVQRIINRHGGRIWAEAEVGKGATFHFSLG